MTGGSVITEGKRNKNKNKQPNPQNTQNNANGTATGNQGANPQQTTTTSTNNNNAPTGNDAAKAAEDANKDPKDNNGKTGLEIKGSNVAKVSGSYDRSDPDAVNKAADAAKGATVTGENNSQKINNLNKAADKWKTVCNSFISAKLTAYEQIAKDYMEIIRAHVRSYGGQDLKNKETDKAKQNADTYEKDRVANQQQQQGGGNENAGNTNAQGGGA
jgi:hypothetical protein